jgi:hypothetical protein
VMTHRGCEELSLDLPRLGFLNGHDGSVLGCHVVHQAVMHLHLLSDVQLNHPKRPTHDAMGKASGNSLAAIECPSPQTDPCRPATASTTPPSLRCADVGIAMCRVPLGGGQVGLRRRFPWCWRSDGCRAVEIAARWSVREVNRKLLAPRPRPHTSAPSGST